MAIDKSKVRGETFEQDPRLVSNPNEQNSEQSTEQPKNTTKNSYDTTYQSPSHDERKSVKVFEHTHALAQEIKFETKEKANIYVYEKAIEYYAKHVLGK
ncbi:hypothetical protein P3T86_14015 (plasmid) [Staphylococcus nepalensis]|uniref:hypothetical protein n=1 Tax=Staphylococcus nepalensis TaxID=214473 RepID=UPI002B25F9A8|nr:hypothetical protein [Staphylococcus nepalensis]WQL21595.1 hypothetical protein P3T86_14015 [Staphylococcus nepalensis]